MSAELRAERQGDSLVLRLHHPESRNALSAALCSAALEALTTAQRDGEIRAVVLTGSEHHFCSGLHDTSALDALHDCILALRDCEPLVVAQWLAAQLLPRPACNEAALPGLGLGAARLHQLGVVNRLCRPTDALQTALQLVEAIPGASGGPRKVLPNAPSYASALHVHLASQILPPLD
ncbi:MAG: enoyl-CoA hydratase [Thiomonas sp. 14-64-326]|nr:MAG: enoyl-CoA hydratase [Thiomonas sp. 14-64-326]